MALIPFPELFAGIVVDRQRRSYRFYVTVNTTGDGTVTQDPAQPDCG